MTKSCASEPLVKELASETSTLPGAQILLVAKPDRRFYLAEIAAVSLYTLVLGGALYYQSKPIDAPTEQPLELVLAPAEPPPEEPPPPPPEPEPPPPPPEAVAPPVAPVAPPPKIEKPKPKPKPVPKVEHKPAPKPQPAARMAARREEAAPAAPVPAGATASVIANQLHGCLARAGASLYPASQKPLSGHVGYRALISASGSVSFNWSSSGNPAFDAAAQRAGARCGQVEAPGRPAALSGAIAFRYN
ncbi:protein TonB [Rhodoblastus acidophilus]|uniref:energy transducer TonB n=1 Tax=Rhodoblastus acidophilus TaxID=1074 RepID=UPI00222551D4|nr:energy transducer TonB [Rhodoblastus acidophilus]MCW2318675.1 protein TonB [Rhodoblastus acidophilus]